MKTAHVNPTDAELALLGPKDTFAIRGTIVAISHITINVRPYPYSRTTREEKYCVLSVGEGSRVLTVACSEKRPLYYDGALENIYGKPVEVGDFITIEATRWSGEAHTTVCAKYSRPTLIEPGDSRRTAFSQLRREVARLTQDFANATSIEVWPQARDLFGKIIMMELTKDERKAVDHIVDTIPVQEQPTYRRNTHGGSESLMRALGVQIETLNRESFMELARQVLKGELVVADSSGRVDLSDLLDYMGTAPFKTSDAYDLIAEVLPIRIDQLVANGKPRSDYYLTEDLINHLVHCDDPRVLSLLSWFITYCCENGHFDTRMFANSPGVSDRGLDSLLQVALDKFENHLSRERNVPDDLDITQVTQWYHFLSAFPLVYRETQTIHSIVQLLKTAR